MTDKFPDEIIQDAMRIMEGHVLAFNNERGPRALIHDIARALLRERQRAAEIALAHGENSLDGPYWAGVNQAAVSISNAILSYDEAQQ